MTTPTIVSGRLSTWAELGKDESFLQEWLKEQPSRLGLGDLNVADSQPVQDDEGNPAFLASDADRYFSVDVRLSEMDASHGFQLLDNWARNRVRHPDKTHVAVLVTETVGDRYRTTLETLSEHLPLVVIELQIWRGESEAILVPHLALSSEDVDLGDTPAAKASAAAPVVANEETPEQAATEPVADAEPAAEPEAESSVDDDDAETAEAVAAVEASSDHSEASPENKDDTGVADSWGMPQAEAEAENGKNGNRLLSKIGS